MNITELSERLANQVVIATIEIIIYKLQIKKLDGAIIHKKSQLMFILSAYMIIIKNDYNHNISFQQLQNINSDLYQAIMKKVLEANSTYGILI